MTIFFDSFDFTVIYMENIGIFLLYRILYLSLYCIKKNEPVQPILVKHQSA